MTEQTEKQRGVVVRSAIKAFGVAMERRARYGRERANDEKQMVMPARFMSVDDMIARAKRNLEQVVNLMASFAANREVPNEESMSAVVNAAADSANYVRMAVEKIRAAEA